MPPGMNFDGAAGQFLNQFGFPPPTGEAAPPGGTPPPQGPPVPFNEIPFGQYLADHPVTDLIPTLPPKFEHGAFGEFAFGTLPPPPPGFPPFPPPPNFNGGFGGFAPPPLPPGTLPPGTPPPPGGVVPPPGTPGFPPPLPDGLPPQMYEFHDMRAGVAEFLAGFEFPPLPPPPSGGGGGVPGPGPILPPPIDFESIKDLLPPTFLPPEFATAAFEYFGQNNPLIGDDHLINPDLEVAAFDHPPLPPGFDGFDFDGDCPQFDDLFTVYDQANVGVPMKGQINSTFTSTDVDGNPVLCSDTTLVDVLLGEALPFVDMGDGVLQTQWVVDVHRVRNAQFLVENPDDPALDEEFDVTTESFSQVTWTVLVQEVDVDGDGVIDQVLTTGSNSIEMIEETVDGTPPPLVEPAPELVLPFEFDTVLDLAGADAGVPDETGDPTAEPAGDAAATEPL